MIYQTLYDLIYSTIFSGATALAWVDLVCTICATLGSLFLVALPFFIVLKICKMIMGV